MATRFEKFEDHHKDFVDEQKLFFVATAAPGGRVNIAPKGMDTLRIIGPNRIIWLSLTGAENETAAHLFESPRMTIMWCSFTTKPMILRAYGNASIIHPRDKLWESMTDLFSAIPGARQIYDVNINFVLKSCGFGVPLYDYVGDRDTLSRWAESKGDEGLTKHWAERNYQSIDGKPTGILANDK
jgi:hypothetical protein